MALKCGIVGLPNVGKSTLFNCLSNAKAQSANFPFCTIEPNIGTISVPDPRLEKLESLVNPERVVPTTMEIVDIAGLVKGASKGEGLGNQFLANIRETDAILHVLRCFDDGNIVHVDGRVDPVSDKEIIDIELQLKDLDTIEKKISSLARVIKSGDKDSLKENELALKIKEGLEKGISVRGLDFTEEEFDIIKRFQLITSKPVMYVCNVDESSVKTGNHHVEAVRKAVEHEKAEVLIIGAKIEADITELETYDERQLFLDELKFLRGINMKLIPCKLYCIISLFLIITLSKFDCKSKFSPTTLMMIVLSLFALMSTGNSIFKVEFLLKEYPTVSSDKFKSVR